MDEFWLHFGSPGGSKGPLFSSKHRFRGFSGGQDGTRGLQGTPELLKWSSKAPKMEPQRSPGLAKRSPGDPQASQKWSQNASKKSGIVYPTKVRNQRGTLCQTRFATMSLTQKGGGAAVCRREASSIKQIDASVLLWPVSDSRNKIPHGFH